MLLFVIVVVFLGSKSGAAHEIPLMSGKCIENFLQIKISKVMQPFNTVLHTNSLQPQTPECLVWQMKQRMDMLANLRMECMAYSINPVNSRREEYKVLIVDIVIKQNKAWLMMMPGGGKVFPPNLMVSDIYEDGDFLCIGVWACEELQGNNQKAAWVMCNSMDVDEERTEMMAKNMSEIMDVPESSFIKTKYATCPDIFRM